MEIRIGHYTLKSDRYCAWLEQDFEVVEGKGKGNIVSRRITGYYRDLRRLLEDFIDMQIKDDDVESVQDAITKLTNAVDDAKAIARAAVKADFQIVRNPK